MGIQYEEVFRTLRGSLLHSDGRAWCGSLKAYGRKDNFKVMV